MNQIAPAQCVSQVDERKHACPPLSRHDAPGDRIKSCFLTEWRLGRPSVTVRDGPPSGAGYVYSNAVFRVGAERNVMYYVLKVFSKLVNNSSVVRMRRIAGE